MQELTKEEKNKILQEHPNIVEVKKVKNFKEANQYQQILELTSVKSEERVVVLEICK